MSPPLSSDIERAVSERYSAGARAVQPALCCPSTSYDKRYLEAIPQEIIDKDYGCGDPTAHCEEGRTVLDLGSGGGKACYIMSQIVGPTGRVIGVDMNDDMLALARKHKSAIARKIGYDNVEFRKGRIQDLKTDVDDMDAWLKKHPVRSAADHDAFQAHLRAQAEANPLVADESVDLIVSNCVLNLVRTEEKAKLFSEMYRVLAVGGRAVISDIVSDEYIPEALQQDEELWSGCISGAFREDLFLEAFEQAGFHGIKILNLDETPWQTVEGIEFRSMTISAYKGKEGPSRECRQAVIYKGPFSAVADDDEHCYERGARVAVCAKTFDLLKCGPYRDDFAFIEPHEPVAHDDAEPFDCDRQALRHPRETKGMDYNVTASGDGDCCGTDGCC
jgi:arsenite methyltransferase